MANGDLIKLGTFYLGGVKKARPWYPWSYDDQPPGTWRKGDIHKYTTGESIEIRNTDTNDDYKIHWREVTIDGRKLLICDRVLLAYVSWDELNAQGLIFGKSVTIDGFKFKMRVLTGGTNFRITNDNYSGGTPTSNEWDQIIANESNFSGLPKPSASDLDTTRDATDLNSQHNAFWNWYSIYSRCQETHARVGGQANRTIRGFHSAKYYAANAADSKTAFSGWRPVLEKEPPTLTLTTTDHQTLSEGKVLSITGSASGVDNGDVLTVKYKINSGTVRNIASGVVNGTPLSFAKNLTFRNKRLHDGTTEVTVDLAENVDHTLTVWAEDDKGGKSAEVTR
ncbi:hypothetical protein HF838_17295, partial [Aneurinibacillus aneurinilyticus]|nr:hypothetical protein [Aneurinibacillus aneurinilyticus]